MAEEDGSLIGLPELKQVSCSMVVIREKSEWNAFPPINHENLQVSSRLSREKQEEEEEEEEQNTPSSFSLLSSDLASSRSCSSISSSSSTSSFLLPEDADEVGTMQPEPSDPRVRVLEARDVGWWWRMGFGGLCSRLRGIVGWPFGCRNAARGRTFWSFVPAAVAVLWLLYWRFLLWRWRRRREGAEKRLTYLIKEKDKKIAELLIQIAQMNELLILQHKASIQTRAT